MRGEGSLTIGELSRRTGRSVHTIRWYEAQGLVPGVARDGGGRRQYTERHVEWFALLGRLKSTGMPLAEMRHYAGLIASGRQGIPAQIALLAVHREKVVQQIGELTEALSLIDAKLADYEAWRLTGKRPRS